MMMMMMMIIIIITGSYLSHFTQFNALFRKGRISLVK